jgi:hypothetical protein
MMTVRWLYDDHEFFGLTESLRKLFWQRSIKHGRLLRVKVGHSQSDLNMKK